jgi:hypothetical protein
MVIIPRVKNYLYHLMAKYQIFLWVFDGLDSLKTCCTRYPVIDFHSPSISSLDKPLTHAGQSQREKHNQKDYQIKQTP